ncbi:FAD dependent oxidoreductase [Penicillium cosmopolitanum]|uniref:FAD dependent oxidoreductase n=1 Tax=Penicillium cosmopolitanum TaxID=1131564 RepID=A0A9W9W398_9EURO|nr:FAD dependent oxidoreductase [Penicillium cosmopolitanum]KAJ5397776.1 FAD dependent oxidoreductase [Penicillium cosmopolitanum]
MSGSPEGIYEPGIVDPKTPLPNYTSPYWHISPHKHANHQSAWPKGIVDVVIIGSGISGMTLARTLVKRNLGLDIVLVDSRQLCAGATGRNGGHIKTMTFAMWAERKKIFGLEEAIRISLFEDSHLEAMEAAMIEDGIDADLVLTEGVEAYYDRPTFDRAVKALEEMRVHIPRLAAKHKVYTDLTLLQSEMKLSSRCVGAIGVPSASVWPYKWITGVLGGLIDTQKINVQTNTTVTSILDVETSEYAVVRTDRGELKARNVIHAENAWVGHLIPELRPFVSPVRVNVVHFGALSDDSNLSIVDKSPFNLDSKYSLWLRYGEKDYDYLIQRNDRGLVVGRACTGRKTTANDSITDIAPMQHLRGFAEEALESAPAGSSSHIDRQGSGIVAFTQDGVPFAGRLPFTGRKHQWVCGAFHATGMIKAFRTSQAVAAMVVGDRSSSDFPPSFLVTEERIRGLQKSLEVGGYPIHVQRPNL